MELVNMLTSLNGGINDIRTLPLLQCCKEHLITVLETLKMPNPVFSSAGFRGI